MRRRVLDKMERNSPTVGCVEIVKVAARVPEVLMDDFDCAFEIDLRVLYSRRGDGWRTGGVTLCARSDASNRHNYPEQDTAIDSAIRLHIDPPPPRRGTNSAHGVPD